MNLFRLLALAIVIWLIVYMIRRALRPRQPDSARPPANATKTQPMVRCARCGLHVPRQDAFPDGERFYCSREHRDEDRAERGHG